MEAVIPYSIPLFIRIHTPDGVGNYVVHSYTPQQLIAANITNLDDIVTLDNVNGRWTVPNTTSTYRVEIVPDTVLTGVEAIDAISPTPPARGP